MKHCQLEKFNNLIEIGTCLSQKLIAISQIQEYYNLYLITFGVLTLASMIYAINSRVTEGKKVMEKNIWRKKYDLAVKQGSLPKSCPYSSEVNFFVDSKMDLDPSPMELFDDWDKNAYPLAAKWLAAGISGQDKPGRLKMGLHSLRDTKFFLIEDPTKVKEYLLLKKKALEDHTRRSKVFQSLDTSLECQRECLELFIDYLPKRYTQIYLIKFTLNI
jgi:hypothetical protein